MICLLTSYHAAACSHGWRPLIITDLSLWPWLQRWWKVCNTPVTWSLLKRSGRTDTCGQKEGVDTVKHPALTGVLNQWCSRSLAWSWTCWARCPGLKIYGLFSAGFLSRWIFASNTEEFIEIGRMPITRQLTCPWIHQRSCAVLSALTVCVQDEAQIQPQQMPAPYKHTFLINFIVVLCFHWCFPAVAIFY